MTLGPPATFLPVNPTLYLSVGGDTDALQSLRDRVFTGPLERTLTSTGHFEDVVFAEASHVVEMSRERYLGVWRSVNDIQAQAGPTVFAAIMKAIEREVEGLPRIRSPYRTRAWTATRAATPGTPLPQ